MQIIFKLKERNPLDFFAWISGNRIVRLKYKNEPIVKPKI